MCSLHHAPFAFFFRMISSAGVTDMEDLEEKFTSRSIEEHISTRTENEQEEFKKKDTLVLPNNRVCLLREQ